MSEGIESNLELKDLVSCGACGSKNLELTHDFGKVPLAGYFPKLEETQIDLIPMKLLYCNECTLHQISPDISDDYLFKDYRYLSSVGMQKHFDELANWFLEKYNPVKSTRILEFGCNDGPLLSSLTNKGFSPIGIDPASNIVQIANKKGLKVFNDFFSVNAVENYPELQDLDFIFSSNSFAHISKISSIAQAVAAALAPSGRFIVEVQSLTALLESTAFDFVYHEHKYYYTLESITNLMGRFGLFLEAASLIPSHGGSYRLVFGKSGPNLGEETTKLIYHEKSIKIDSETIGKAVLKYKLELEKLDRRLVSLHSQGKRIIAFGASGRANMILGNLSKSRALIERVIDESPERYGRLMAQNQIPIVPLNNLDLTNYSTMVILAWNYADEILTKLKNRNLEYLIPLPILKEVCN